MPFDVDPNRPIEELLSAIHVGAVDGAKSASRTSTFAIAPFAALLVRLAQDADRTANKVVRLTWALIGLTIGLLIFTAVLVWQEHANKTAERKEPAAHSGPQADRNPVGVVHSTPPK